MWKNRNRAWLGIAIVSLLLITGYGVLYINESERLEGVGNYVVLNGKTSTAELSEHFHSQGIFEDSGDAVFAARWITARIGGSIPNLGQLNNDSFRIPADSARYAGESFKKNVESSERLLGIDEKVKELYSNGSVATMLQTQGDELSRVSIHIQKTKTAIDTLKVGSSYNVLRRIPYFGKKIAEKLIAIKKRALQNQEGVPGVIVRVRDYSIDRSGVDLGYVMSDSSGIATAYLPSEGYYSFLPVRPGFEYGAPKGTRNGPLRKTNVHYSFRQRPHTIRLFDSHTYRRIKEDVLLTVRTPHDYRHAILLYPALFLVAWWLFFLFLSLCDRRKRTESDFMIPLTLMCLSGIGLLAMFSIVHPLTDTILGSSMTIGAIIGIILMGLASRVDWGFFYAVGIRRKWGVIQFDFILQFIGWISLPFMEKIQSFKLEPGAGVGQVAGYYMKLHVALLTLPLELLCRMIGLALKWLDKGLKKLVLAVSKNPGERVKSWIRRPFHPNLPKGFGYIVIVLFSIFLLLLFGDGPEGSGTRVNLFFFQPSELNKYLVVLFMASFFATRSNRITLFSEVADALHIRLQLKTVFLILFSLAVLLALYLMVMSDMGPALVIIVTFIFLYSIARKDFGELIAGVATFVVLIWLAGIISGGSLVVRFIIAITWVIGWILFWYIRDRRLYESAIFFNFLLSAFLFAGPFMSMSRFDAIRNVGQRIIDRNDVAMHIWDNSVRGGGDQVVQGIWSLASGGLFGQGLGKGNPNLVPAFHTDMIFTSIGEEMGWIVILAIVLCFAILLHRTFVVAYNSGNRFLFFLTNGIAVVTGVQFFVIVFGSIGIIPLTGVAVPFLSYGMTSLVINLAVFGVVVSVSKTEATDNQHTVNQPYRHTAAIGIGSFLLFSLMLAVILFVNQVFPPIRNNNLVRPAFLASNDGFRIAEYNPRIRLLLKEMKAGNLLDRNGLLLATSNRNWYETFTNQADSTLIKYLDGDDSRLSRERNRLHTRYYPFGRHTFFVVGDLNTQTLWGIDNEDPYGFLAEERLLEKLRGFSTVRVDNDYYSVKDTLRAMTYYSTPFSAPIDTIITFNRKDYRPLLPYLKDGIHGRQVHDYNEASLGGERDVRLTLDARLQTILQSRMNSFLNDPACRYNSKVRPKLRASVVVLDASGGDVLSSANYPLPDQQVIREAQKRREDYLKYEKKWNNPTYTDRDLGATFPSAPGSTAKIMSAMAGFMHDGVNLDKQEYDIRPQEQIHSNSVAVGSVSLKTAIVYSSNCYFINLVNQKDLYPQLERIYSQVGAGVGGPSYSLFRKEVSQSTFRERMKVMHQVISGIEGNAIKEYLDYMEKRTTGKYERMAKGSWQLPWGQYPLEASPLAMARVASAVYNGGSLPETHWVVGEVSEGTRLITPEEAALLKDYMYAESDHHIGLPVKMGGKTGTPERERQFSISSQTSKFNDGWYIFFVETKDGRGLSAAIRLERVGVNGRGAATKDGSGAALDFVKRVVVPSLCESGYEIEIN